MRARAHSTDRSPWLRRAGCTRDAESARWSNWPGRIARQANTAPGASGTLRIGRSLDWRLAEHGGGCACSNRSPVDALHVVAVQQAQSFHALNANQLQPDSCYQCPGLRASKPGFFSYINAVNRYRLTPLCFHCRKGIGHRCHCGGAVCQNRMLVRQQRRPCFMASGRVGGGCRYTQHAAAVGNQLAILRWRCRRGIRSHRQHRAAWPSSRPRDGLALFISNWGIRRKPAPRRRQLGHR